MLLGHHIYAVIFSYMNIKHLLYVVKILCMLTILYNDGASMCSAKFVKFASIYFIAQINENLSSCTVLVQLIYICKMIKSCSV